MPRSYPKIPDHFLSRVILLLNISAFQGQKIQSHFTTLPKMSSLLFHSQPSEPREIGISRKLSFTAGKNFGEKIKFSESLDKIFGPLPEPVNKVLDSCEYIEMFPAFSTGSDRQTWSGRKPLEYIIIT